MRLKALVGAIAALAAGASVAHADIYTLIPNPITPGVSSTSPTVNHPGGTTFTDDFIFNILDNYDTLATALYFKGKNVETTQADLTLFSGTPGSGTAIDTTGFFDPTTNPGGAPTLEDVLNAGAYYLEASVFAPAGKTSAYNVGVTVEPVAGVPEPASWALMFSGVALAGLGLQFARRRSASAAA